VASENKNFSAKISKNALYFIQLGCAILGLGLSIYLLVQHTRLKNGMQGDHSFCYLGAHADCDAVNISDYAEVLGVPLASYGAAFYFLVLLLGLWAAPKAKGFSPFQRTITWLSVAALFVDLGLAFIQAFKLHNFCILCFSSYLFTIGIFVTGALLQGRERAGNFLRKALLDPMPSRSPVPAAPVIITAVSLVCFVTMILLIPGSIQMKSTPYTNVKDAGDKFFELWKELPSRKIPVKKGDATLGNSAAKVQIVEFSDFQCPFCQRGAFVIHEALQSYGNRVFFVFKNYPLDSECNKAVNYQMHIYACRMARMAYCAERKGKFWEFHDAAFFKWQEIENRKSESEKKKGDALVDAVKSGLFAPVFNEAEYQKCLADNASMDNVKADTELGTSMGITGTPTVYINGKQVAIPITPENLRKLIEIEESLP
jgi:protein-disulfide isomerase/uncharacterized membrane protein